MADDAVQLKFRVPAAVRSALERTASANGRSLSAEITARLETSLRDDEADQSLEHRVAELERRLAKNEELTRSLFLPNVRNALRGSDS